MTRRKLPEARRQEHSAAPPLTACIVGYARVSTEDQNLDVQMTALRAAGAQKLYVEKISALNAKRSQFSLMMKFLEPGDTLVFHALSRIGRDVKQILAILDELNRDGIAWRSITEPHLDHSTAAGRLMLGITSVMAQFERDQIVDRTKRGMAERKRQGMWIGRKPKVSPADARTMAGMRRKNVKTEIIAKKFGVKPSTVYARTNALKKK